MPHLQFAKCLASHELSGAKAGFAHTINTSNEGLSAPDTTSNRAVEPTYSMSSALDRRSKSIVDDDEESYYQSLMGHYPDSPIRACVGGSLAARLHTISSEQDMLELFPLSIHLTFVGLVKFWEALEAGSSDIQVTESLSRYGISAGDFDDLTKGDMAAIGHAIMRWKMEKGLWRTHQGAPQPAKCNQSALKRCTNVPNAHIGMDEYVAVDVFGKPPSPEKQTPNDRPLYRNDNETFPKQPVVADSHVGSEPSRFASGGPTIRLIENLDTEPGNGGRKSQRTSKRKGRSSRKKPVIPERTSSKGAPLEAWMENNIDLDHKPDLTLYKSVNKLLDEQATSLLSAYLIKLRRHVNDSKAHEPVAVTGADRVHFHAKQQSLTKRIMRWIQC